MAPKLSLTAAENYNTPDDKLNKAIGVATIDAQTHVRTLSLNYVRCAYTFPPCQTFEIEYKKNMFAKQTHSTQGFHTGRLCVCVQHSSCFILINRTSV